MKSIRSVRSSKWVWLTAIGLGLVACGGAQEVPRPTGPVKKVAWGGSEAEPEAEEAAPAEAKEPKQEEKAEAGAEDDELSTGGNVIDLDAVAAKAPPKPAPSAAPAPEPQPEPAAPVAAAEEEDAEEPAPPPPPKAKAKPQPESPASDPLAAELRRRRAQAKARAEARKEREEEEAPPKKAKAEDEAAAVTYKGADPCRATSFSVARVREACATGGRAAAKRVMKDAIGNATATGQLLKCSSCHANQNDYSLKDDAVTQLQRWLSTSSS